MWEDAAGSQITLNASYYNVFIPASSHFSHIISEEMEPVFRNVHLEQVKVEKLLIRARIKLVLHILALPNPRCISILFPSFLLLFFKTSKALNAAQASCKSQKSLGYWHIFWSRAPPSQVNRPSRPPVPGVIVTRNVAWK